MPLAHLAAPPTEQTQSLYDFAHYQDHLQILQATNAKMGTKLQPRVIYPSAGQGADWQRLHQTLHDEMNKALGNNGQNLQGEMNATWYDQNYREHNAAKKALGI